MRSIPRALLILTLGLSAAACAHSLQEEDLSDPAIRARIEFLLRGRRDLDLSHVTIDVYSRVVTISGIAATPKQSSAILRLVNGVHGVDEAINNLIVPE